MKDFKQEESPHYVKTSLAGAISLGLERGSFHRDAYPGSLNLLMTYGESCSANCGYCGLARERKVNPNTDTFIRVKWPGCELNKIIDILANPPRRVLHKTQKFERICISMITHRRAAEDCLSIVEKINRRIDLPVSVLICPTIIKNRPVFFAKLKESGVDRIGVAVDTATETLFVSMRGQGVGGPHNWDIYWQAVQDAVSVFGQERVSVHLIVGLGETEKEMVETIYRANEHGAKAHLFSFCPEPGSALENHQPPSFGRYRRCQIAAYLLNNGQISVDCFEFDAAGKIIGYGKALNELLGKDLAKGGPFMTLGCPNKKGCVACNRPFSNERPGLYLRNYPFPPSESDMEIIQGQIWDE